MKRQSLFLLFLIIGMVGFAQGEVKLTLHLDTPGTLWDLVEEQNISHKAVTDITLTGNLNEEDFRVMSKLMAALEYIDLSGTTVTSIPQNAFDGKSNLKRCSLPANVTNIGSNAFRNCSELQNIANGDKIQHIESRAFSNCSKLENIPFGDKIRSIESYAFESCSSMKGEILFPACLYQISSGAFRYCYLLSRIDLSNCTLSEIPYDCFFGCSGIQEIKLPSKCADFGPMGEPMTYTISNGAFSGTGIEKLIIPASVSSILSNAFHCNQLKHIQVLSTSVIAAEENTFSSVDKSTCILNVPTGAVKKYSFANEWSSFANIEAIGLKVNIGANGALYQNAEKVASGDVVFHEQKPATFTVIPAPGYQVDKVMLDKVEVPVVNNKFTVGQAIKGATLSVSYVLKKFDLDIIVSGNGSLKIGNEVLPNLHSMTIDSASIVNFVLLPQSGNAIDYIRYNGKECAAQQGDSLFVTPFAAGNARLEVAFASQTHMGTTHKVNVSVGNNGSVVYKNTPLLAQTDLTVKEGEQISFAITPDKYYKINRVTYNGEDVTNRVVDGQLMVDEVRQGGNLEVIFALNPTITVYLDAPGTLSSELIQEQYEIVTNLTIIGKINENDYHTMRDNLKVLSIVDLTQTRFSDGGAYGNMQRVPYMAFCFNYSTDNPEGKQTLTEVRLPSDIEMIAEYAFAGCSYLKKINFNELINLHSINSRAFNTTGLIDIDLSNTKLTSLTNSEFSYNKQIRAIKFPTTLGSLDNQFSATAIEEVDLRATKVTRLSDNSFSQCRSLIKAYLPDRLESISSSSFYGCESLDEIDFPVTLKRIENSAFSSCGLKTIDLSHCKNLTMISEYAFQSNAACTSVKLPDSVTDISDYAFISCRNLLAFVWPARLKSIGTSAFSECGLQTIDLSHCKNLTVISEYAFQSNTACTSIKLPDSVTTLESNAFNGCVISEILELPASVVSIGDNALPGGMPIFRINAVTPPKLSQNALSSSTLVAVFVPKESVTAYKRAPYWEEYIILGGETKAEVEVTTPGNLAIDIMEQAQLAPALVTHLKVRGTLNRTDFDVIRSNMTVLYDLDLSEADIEVIPEKAFLNKSMLMHVRLPEKLLIIEKEAFKDCTSLRDTVTITDNVSIIGESAFENCRSLTNVHFGKNLSKIDAGAFYNCAGLKQEITFPDKLVTINGGAFYGCYGLYGSIIFPTSLRYFEESYLQNSGQHIGQTFSYCNNIEVVDFSACDSLKTIAKEAFSSCSKLHTVTLPANLQKISSATFRHCNNLVDINFPATLLSIDEEAFNYCSYLRVANLYECKKLHTIEKNAFDYCKALQTVNIPASVSRIGDYAFRECRSLANLSMLNPVPASLGEYVFRKVYTDVCVLSIPTEAYYDYLVAAQWGAFVQMRKAVSIALDEGAALTYVNNADMEEEAGSLFSRKHKVAQGDAVAVDGSSIYVKENETLSFYITPDEHVAIEQVLYNDQDVTNDVINNMYTTPKVTDRSILRVKLKTTGEIAVSSVNLNKKSLIMRVADRETLTATVLPHNATNKEIMWMSSDESVAIVDANGNIQAISGGSTVIRAIGENGVKGECAVTVLSNDYYFSMQPANVFTNSNANIPVSMHNAGEVVAFQCDIYLPDGVSFQSTWGDYNISLTERSNGHTVLAAQQWDGSVRVIVYSMTNTAFTGTDGELFNIPVRVTGEEGTYEVMIKNIHVTGIQSIDFTLPDISTRLIINGYELGDSNGDGKVTISDVTNTINHILGNYTYNFVTEAADANQDGKITIADIAATVNIVLQAGSPSAYRLMTKAEGTFDKLYIDDFNIAPGETKVMKINLSDIKDYTALQCDVKLPEGLEFVENNGLASVTLSERKSETHHATTLLREDGSIRLAVYSGKNDNFLPNEGAVVEIAVKAKADFNTQQSTIELTNGLLSTQSAEEFAAPMTTAFVNATPLTIPDKENGGLKIYANGRNLHIVSDIETTVLLASMDGTAVLLSVNVGDNIFPIEQPGVYLVNRQKIIIK